jgi:hypothetical protein
VADLLRSLYRPYLTAHSLVETDGPYEGRRYMELSEELGGRVADIEDGDWTAFLDLIAEDELAHSGMRLDGGEDAPELWILPPLGEQTLCASVWYEASDSDADGLDTLACLDPIGPGSELWVVD